MQGVSEVGLWLYDLPRGVLTALQTHGEVSWLEWSPDTRQLVFGLLRDGAWQVVRLEPDGIQSPEVLADGFSAVG